MEKNRRVAVFIDGENIPHTSAERIFNDVSNYGDVIIRRVYGDWSSQAMKGWIEKVEKLAIKPQQQFALVKGKNASDISLAISAMSVLFEKDIEVFCIASSDSDFSSLIQELREREKTVIGFGMKKIVKQSYVNSFNEYFYLDALEEVIKPQTNQKTSKTPSKVKPKVTSRKLPKDRIQALSDIVIQLIEQSGKALFSAIGSEMKNKFSDFIPKNYGYKTMMEFVTKNLEDIGEYQLEKEKDGTTWYLRHK